MSATPGPKVEVGPLGWMLFWAIVIFGIIGLLFAPTLIGGVIFALAVAVLLLIAYFIVRRGISRASGRR